MCFPGLFLELCKFGIYEYATKVSLCNGYYHVESVLLLCNGYYHIESENVSFITFTSWYIWIDNLYIVILIASASAGLMTPHVIIGRPLCRFQYFWNSLSLPDICENEKLFYKTRYENL